MVGVRLAQIEDISRISLVLATSWKAAYRGGIVNDDYLDSLKDDHWIDFLSSGLISGLILSMVLQEGQDIIGAAILRKTEQEKEVHLVSLYLLPDKIGQGLGHIFYSEIEKGAIERGYTTCVLDVLESNSRAVRFYKTHGFEYTGIEGTATLGDQSYVYKVMGKILEAT